MIEIFDNIPTKVKENAEMVFDLALHFHSPTAIAKFLDEYANSCQNEEEHEFVNFYFNMRMAQLLNEDFDDKR